MNEDRFQKLVARYFDGEITTAACDELSTLLLDSAKLRREFVLESQLHRELFDSFAATSIEGLQDLLAAEVDAVAQGEPITGSAPAGPAVDAAQPLGTQPKSARPILGFLIDVCGNTISGATTFSLVSLSLGALLASLGWIGLGFWITSWRTPRVEVAEQFAAGPGAARITAADGCRWRSNGPLEVGSDLSTEPLELAEGRATFALASGVQVSVQGPSRFRLVSADRLHLEVGKLQARVPRRAHGFTVATPCAEVVDLGTEFEVQVTGPDNTDVQVLTGSVDLRPVRNGAAPTQSRLMTAGSALRVSGADRQITAIAYDASRFGPPETEMAAATTSVDPRAAAANDSDIPSNFFEYGQIVAGYQDFFNGTHFDPGWIEISNGKRVPTGSTNNITLPGDGTLHLRRGVGDPNKLLYADANYARTGQIVLAMIRINSPLTGGPPESWRGGVGVSADVNDRSAGINFVVSPSGLPEGRRLHTNLMNDFMQRMPVNVDGMATDNYYWMRLTYDGDTAKAKVWSADGATPEPGDWQIIWFSPGRGGLAGLVGDSGGNEGQIDLQVNYVLIQARGLPSTRAGISPQVTAGQSSPVPVGEGP